MSKALAKVAVEHGIESVTAIMLIYVMSKRHMYSLWLAGGRLSI
jgi:hypothetical protein